MNPVEDRKLLLQYALSGSQEAFGEVVAHNIDWVYSLCRRWTASADLAEDVTQAVFAALARKAKSVARHPSIAGWLFRAARFGCLTAAKLERRRKRHEREAALMTPTIYRGTGQLELQETGAVLDEAIFRLSVGDREIIILRFYQDKGLSDVGKTLGISYDAARKRVSRAVEKLREDLAGRGITCSVGAIAPAITRLTQPAPAGLAATTLSAAMGHAAGSAVPAILKGALQMMFWTKVKLIAIAGALVLASGVLGSLAVRGMINAPGSAPSSDVTAKVPTTRLIEDRNLIHGLVPLVRLSLDLVDSGLAQWGQARAAVAQAGAEPPAGTLVLRLQGEPRAAREVVLFFFAEQPWPGPPQYLCRAQQNTTVFITGLSEGSYRILAMRLAEGAMNTFQEIGIPRDWPAPATVTSRGARQELDIEMSPRLTETVRETLASEWRTPRLNAAIAKADDALHAYGQVTDDTGAPIGWATVQFREHLPGANSILAWDAVTNSKGYYGIEGKGKVKAYTLGVVVVRPLKSAVGMRYQYLTYNKVYEGKQEVNFRIPSWPREVGQVEGKVLDAAGKPFEPGIVEIRPDHWPDAGQLAGKEYTRCSVRAGFQGGRFLLDDVPAGKYRLEILALHGSTYPAGQGVVEKLVTVIAGKTLRVDLQVPPPKTDARPAHP